MKKYVSFPLSLIILVFLSGCETYAPRAYYAPVFKEAGDLSAAVGLKHQEIGYAFCGFLGVYAMHTVQYPDITADYTNGSKRDIVSKGNIFGLIPYYKLSNNVYFEMPISYGWSHSNGTALKPHEQYYHSSFHAENRFYSVQPTITFIEYEDFDFSFFSHIRKNYTSVLDATLNQGTVNYVSSFDKLVYENNQFDDFSIQFGFQQRFGTKNIRFYLQGSINLYSKPKFDLDQRHVIRSGLQVNFNAYNFYRNTRNFIKNSMQKTKKRNSVNKSHKLH